MADVLFDLIFKPGTSLQLVPIINISVLLLFGVLAFLLYTQLDVIHIIVMGFLAIGLLLSVNWVYYIAQSDKENNNANPELENNGDKNKGNKVDSTNNEGTLLKSSQKKTD